MSNENRSNRDTFGEGMFKLFILLCVVGSIGMGSYLMFEKIYELTYFVAFIAMIATIIYLDNRKKKD